MVSWGQQGDRSLTEGTGKLWGETDILLILIVGVVSWVYTYIKTYQIVHFKDVQMNVRQLYLSKVVKKMSSIQSEAGQGPEHPSCARGLRTSPSPRHCLETEAYFKL